MSVTLHGDMRVIEEGRPRSSFRGFLMALVLLLAILWGALYGALRTGGGRNLVAARLSKHLNTALTVEETRLRFPLTLRMQGVQSEDYTEGSTGFRAREVQIRLGLKPWVWVTLLQPELNMIWSTEAGWSPAVFRAVGDLPGSNIGTLETMCQPWRRSVRLNVVDGTLRWFGEQSRPLAWVDGVVFRVAPIALPDRTVYVHQFAADRVVDGGAGAIENTVLEWISGTEGGFVEIARSASLPPANGTGFWSVTHGNTAGH